MKERENILKQLEVKIEKDTILKQNCDIDTLLDLREEEVFDSEWIRVFQQLEKFEISSTEKQLIDTIREKSFLQTYHLLESSDIAACVSDDFELICKAYLSGFDDTWLNSVIMSYVSYSFPCGEVEKTEYALEESMKCLIQ